MAELDEIRRSIEDSLHMLDSHLRKMQEEWSKALSQIKKQLAEGRKEIQRTLGELFTLEMWAPLKKEHIEDFVRKPYLIRQVSESEFEVIVPKFIDFYPGTSIGCIALRGSSDGLYTTGMIIPTFIIRPPNVIFKAKCLFVI